MVETISILRCITPRYGEILIGVGSIIASYQEDILDNLIAIEQIKQYLLTEASQKMDLKGVADSEMFQKIIYEYTGKTVGVHVLREKGDLTAKVNLLMVAFFRKLIWPILVNQYIDKISPGIEKITIGVNIKKKVYVNIYKEDKPDLFFKEFKEYLLWNNIIINSAKIKENGDMLLTLMIPVIPT